MFEWDEEAKGWTFAHNPFAMPHAEALDRIWSPTRPRCRAYTYDLVCNGSEAASGSIRIHKRDIQERIFKMLGKTDEQIQAQFGHMLDAFDFGAPPHGGMAPGIGPPDHVPDRRRQHPRSDRLPQGRRRLSTR